MLIYLFSLIITATYATRLHTKEITGNSNYYEMHVTSTTSGGMCTCPDGSEYAVSTRSNNCRSLNCIGGTVTSCFNHRGTWSYNKVTCAPKIKTDVCQFYTNWVRASQQTSPPAWEPNNVEGTEKCVEMYASDKKYPYKYYSVTLKPNVGTCKRGKCVHGQWNDKPCQFKRHFVCEIQRKDCSRGWTGPVDDKCFKYFSLALNHNAASTHCHKLGGYLASPSSAKIQQTVEKFLDIHGQSIWIGLYEGGDDRFLWENGSTFIFDRKTSTTSCSQPALSKLPPVVVDGLQNLIHSGIWMEQNKWGGWWYSDLYKEEKNNFRKRLETLSKIKYLPQSFKDDERGVSFMFSEIIAFMGEALHDLGDHDFKAANLNTQRYKRYVAYLVQQKVATKELVHNFQMAIIQKFHSAKILRSWAWSRHSQSKQYEQLSKNALQAMKSTNNYQSNIMRSNYGGLCTCPDGNVYAVAATSDDCDGLACGGGLAGQCHRSKGVWSKNKVTCGHP